MATKEQYKAFVDACQELKNSKIILADAKVSAILRSIVSNPTLVEVVGETLVGYNFLNELENLSRSQDNKYLPSEPRKIIAFVFSLLSEIDARRLDLQEFVDQYCKADTLLESFGIFNNELIDPFCKYLCDWVNIDLGSQDCESEDLKCTEEDNDECDCEDCESEDCESDADRENIEQHRAVAGSVEEFFQDVSTILTQIKDTLALDSKVKADRSADINITINAMFEAIKLENLRIFNALLISLNTLLHSIKSVRFYHMELGNRVADFYKIA